MSGGGSLRRAWEYLPAELWEPLAEYAADDGAAPADLFGDLFAEASEYLALPPSEEELALARSEPAQGRARFLALTGSDFASDFEHSFNQYCRTSSETELRNCLLSAGKYAEGLAGHTCDETGSLGDLCNSLRDWPHATSRESLSKLYGFLSSYPNLRRAGNPWGALRSLATRDVTALSVIMLAFSGYLTPELDQAAVLGVSSGGDRSYSDGRSLTNAARRSASAGVRSTGTLTRVTKRSRPRGTTVW